MFPEYVSGGCLIMFPICEWWVFDRVSSVSVLLCYHMSGRCLIYRRGSSKMTRRGLSKMTGRVFDHETYFMTPPYYVSGRCLIMFPLS